MIIMIIMLPLVHGAHDVLHITIVAPRDEKWPHFRLEALLFGTFISSARFTLLFTWTAIPGRGVLFRRCMFYVLRAPVFCDAIYFIHCSWHKS